MSRKAGTPNKATANAKAAIARFVDRNTDRLDNLLERIENEQGPQAAWKCIMDLIEYHVPKMQRVEHSGEMTVNNRVIANPLDETI